jgi:hypothetical protein
MESRINDDRRDIFIGHSPKTLHSGRVIEKEKTSSALLGGQKRFTEPFLTRTPL